MKILHIQGQYYPYGGAETYLRDLCKSQVEMGHEVFLMYASPLPDGSLGESWVHHFDSSWGIRTGISRKNKILRFINDKAPDVIHMHVVHFAISPIVLKAICKRWPVVYTVHDILWLCMKSLDFLRFKDSARILPNEHVCNSRVGLNCILKGCLFSVLSKAPAKCAKRIIITLWRLNAFKRVSQFIVNSEYMKERLIDHSFSEESIRIVRPYLSVPATWASDDVRVESPHQDSTILFIGKLSKYKGVYDLIDAVVRIKSSNWKLVIIGDGEERGRLPSYARLRKVSDSILIEGPVKREELSSYYRNASIVVLPSRCPETFGLVGLEAMYFGKPVIAYDAGAIREWLDNGHAGYLVKPGDINELSRRIVNLLRDPHLQKEMGKCGQVKALSFNDKERFVNEILSTYEDAIESFAIDRQKSATRWIMN